jgi:hypothetical protein
MVIFYLFWPCPSSLAKGYDPLYSSEDEMSRADRNPWLAKMDRVKQLPENNF